MKNLIEVDGAESQILIEKDGKSFRVTIDTASIPRLCIVPNWWLLKKMSNACYPVTHIDGATVYLARWLMQGSQEIPTGFVVDHVDGNPLDARLSNLQCISHADNTRKQKVDNKPFATNSSGYRGVGKFRDGWTARVSGLWCGLYDTAEEANEVCISVREMLTKNRLVRLAA